MMHTVACKFTALWFVEFGRVMDVTVWWVDVSTFDSLELVILFMRCISKLTWLSCAICVSNLGSKTMVLCAIYWWS